MNINTFDFIIGISLLWVGILILQTYLIYVIFSVNQKLNPIKEIEFIDTIEAYIETKLENEKNKANWDEFYAETQANNLMGKPKEPSEEHIKERIKEPKRDKNGKYNPDEVPGILDSFIEKDKK